MYEKELSFYSCTVSNFEQYTLAKFIEKGYLEKHINRMRNYYRTLRDALLTCIKNQPGFSKVTILEEDAGLHFLLKVDTSMNDMELIHQAALQGLHVSCLSQYYYMPDSIKTNLSGNTHTLIINYSGIHLSTIEEALTNVLNRRGGTGDGGQTIILECDKVQFGKLIYKLNQSESKRHGVSLVGV